MYKKTDTLSCRHLIDRITGWPNGFGSTFTESKTSRIGIQFSFGQHAIWSIGMMPPPIFRTTERMNERTNQWVLFYWADTPLLSPKGTLTRYLSSTQLQKSSLPSATRLGNLLHFGQLFKAFGSNYFAQIALIFSNFWRCENHLFF